MSLSIQLHSIECLNESDEISASDEVYVLATVAALRPPVPGLPALANLRVFRYGLFEDMDDDDREPVVVDGPAFWGMDGVATDIQNPADVGVVISLIEQDNGVPEQYQELVNVRAGLSLASAMGASQEARADRLATDISNVLNGIDLPIPFALDDDHIGTQRLALDGSDLIAFGSKDKALVIAGDGAQYRLTFRIRRLPRWAAPFPIAPRGHAVPGAIPAYSRHPDHIDVFWVGPDGGVGTTFWSPATGWAAPFPIAPRGHAAPGAITAHSRHPDHIDVFWVGPDGGVGTTFWSPATGWAAPFPIAPRGHAVPGAI